MWLEPLGLIHGPAAAESVVAGFAVPLAGGPVAFTLARSVAAGRIRPVGDFPQAVLAPLLSMPPVWLKGLPCPAVMGILNVTPDSFSDAGRHMDPATAVAAGLEMAEKGADIIDIGGETTRPRSAPTPPDIEQARVLPVIAALAARGVRVSIDTRNASTMAAALDAGAAIVNDVSGLAYDPLAIPLLASRDCPIVLMHMRGTPTDMPDRAEYHDVALDVAHELAASVAAAEQGGIARGRIMIDPGIGFAKRPAQSQELLARLPLLLNLGCPMLVGVSRKGFIGALSGETQAARRAPGSIAAGLHAVLHGAAILRVHDVAETVQALRVWQGLG